MSVFIIEFSQTVRLRGGRYDHEGRVEVLRHGEWGTVCGCFQYGWDRPDATVVCKSLGYPSFQYPNGYCAYPFEQGPAGRIWLDEVDCIGTESNLEDCNHRGWGIISDDCARSTPNLLPPAGVICQCNFLLIFSICVVEHIDFGAFCVVNGILSNILIGFI